MYDGRAMPKSPKSKNLVARFNYPMRVDVRRGEFEPLDSVRLLDKSKLREGSHTLCVGYVQGGCCPAKTFATVRAGKVIDVTVEACKEGRKLTKEAKAIVKEAQRRGHIRKRGRWRPVPVDEFFSSPAKMAKIIVSGWETEGGGCAQICWGDAPIMDCVWCCRTGDELECGFVQIVIDEKTPD
jgi:hypothetical protein